MRTAHAMHGSQPGRARHLLVLALALVLLVVLIGVVIGAVRLFTGGGDAETGSSTPAGTGSETGQPTTEGEIDPDTGLPGGSSSESGLPVGFPRTELGAAAVVVELNRAQIGFDYDTAVTTIRVYADPADQAFFDQLATSAVAQRRSDLNVPSEGGVDAPAAYAQTPIGYRVEEYGPGYYLVSVLNEVTTTTASGEVGRSLYVGQQLVAWTGEDWKLVEPTEDDRAQLLATPVPPAAALGTPEFDTAGWTALYDQPTGSTTE